MNPCSDSVRDAGWVLRPTDAAFPACVLDSPEPPERIHGFGDTELLRPGIAIVGSRRASPYGLRLARLMAACAASAGVVVVSGAATGCDAAAQQAALDAGGATVAVLGCGADVDYPSSSRPLLERLRNDGAVISERGWGAPPVRWAFPRRNRIIAALSAAVLVVEAALPSGTFLTADHALDAGREVLAVPGSVFFERSAGCNRLICQGAAPITCAEDLLDAMASLGLGRSARAAAEAPGHVPVRRPPVEADLWEAVLADPSSIERLAVALRRDVVDVGCALSLLECEGYVARYPDGRYGPA